MRTLIASMSCVFVLVASSVNAAESWVWGTGVNKAVAKEAALETASANLPVGVPFVVVSQNFVAGSPVASENYVPNNTETKNYEANSAGSKDNAATSTSARSNASVGYTCNLLVRYGTGIVVLEGKVYHAHTQAERNAKAAAKATQGNKTSSKSAKTSSKSAKMTHTKLSTNHNTTRVKLPTVRGSFKL